MRFGAENQKRTLITGQKHQEASASASAETTLDLKSDRLDKARKKSEGLCLAPSFSDQVTESELLWCYKVAASDFSFRSCDNIGKLFERMFKCSIAEQFSISRTKASYIISDAIRPFLLEQIVKEVIDGNLGYVLMFDETTTAQQCRQMDVLICYSCQNKEEVSVRFLKAFQFGHATADIVSEALLGLEEDTEERLPLKNLISI